MGIDYQNLDDVTRKHMADEVALGNHYMSPRLTAAGLAAWPGLLANAVARENDDWLAEQLLAHGHFRSEESYTRNGKQFTRRINQESSAVQLAEGEFNRIYVRALCIRATEAGQDHLVVYRGKAVAQPRPESEAKIGTSVPVVVLLEALRKNDFVTIESALGVPGGPNSGLTCRLP
ncbi:MAG: hypothetical protein IIZ92_18845 [Aquincola sp.]|uniref:hypothetical protein n=1 Tax=uncultured Aquincola sp. TaxID=886556 RepID=UPI0032B1C238|nr:hypothetical protein [Aquincola sp.]|tara:strand:+ start:598 stop:1125 length:528 start_codon:yes stop_codon:yes gene_type:complete